ncbi:hypothetical protein QBC35DRAFT_503868 [Podospora australis]|uniref:Uncharacterized protein n=1 Tax=Podospora australis TaxID=1536484 RepID=A0AAN6WPI0_9PEZI|nr:hypothetical protein QBC35DRAFT_503868 [Podospora australis]
MSSSTTTSNNVPLSRMRSLRKPTTRTTESGSEGGNGNGSGGQTSPSRLPARGIATASSSRAIASTPTATAGAGAGRTSRPVSGVFSSRMTPLPPARPQQQEDEHAATTTTTRTRTTTTTAATSTTRQTRAASIRQTQQPDDAAPTSRLTRAASIWQPTKPDDVAASASSTTRLNRAPSIRQVSTSSSTVSSSTPSSRRPTTSSGVSSRTTGSRIASTSSSSTTSGAAGHARAKSSVTTLSSTTILRPPSQGSVASATTTSSVEKVGPSSSSDRSKPPITRSSKAAAATQHKRIPSTSSNTTRPPPILPKTKPEFNTHQQHFSPLKSLAPKPLTATFLAPPSPSKLPANQAISAETSRLQTELLQLHLLHRDAVFVTREWEHSARTQLGERFSQIVQADALAREAENSLSEDATVKALLRYLGPPPELESKIQFLDGTLQDIWALTEPGSGKHSRLMKRFDKWLLRAEDIISARRSGEQSSELIGKFLGEVVDEDSFFVIKRKVEEMYRGLKEHGLDFIPEDEKKEEEDGEERTVEEEEGLGSILKGVNALVKNMLAELGAVEDIQREVSKEETKWVREMNRAGEAEEEEKRRAGAIWRVL